MTTEQILIIGSWIMATMSWMVAFAALRKAQAVKFELERNYWTKDVIGKTINAKTGKDPKAAEKAQEKVLNEEAEEIVAKGVKEFCEIMEKNIDNEMIPCCNPRALQIGFSYVDNQKFYVTLHLSLFKEGQDDLPVQFEKDMEAGKFIQKLIDHYKEKK